MTPRIQLRDPVEADLPLFYEHQADPVGAAMVGGPSRDREAFMAHWAKTSLDPTAVRKTIVFEGRTAGYVGRFERAGFTEKPEVCYWLGNEYWGKGVATAALALFLREDRTRPLWARVAKRNPASLRVLEKCGFKIAHEDEYTGASGEKIPELVLKLD